MSVKPKSISEVDLMKVELYKDFYKQNIDLYERDRVKFFRRQRLWVESQLERLLLTYQRK